MKVGATVSLRVSTPDGPTEVVGVVVRHDAEVLVVRRRDGRVVDIPVAAITAQRVVPPGPAQRISVAELDRLIESAAATRAHGGRTIVMTAEAAHVLRAARAMEVPEVAYDGTACRAVVDGRWVGLLVHETDAAAMVAAVKWAVAEGARHCWVEVDANDEAAATMCQQLGYTSHHDAEHQPPPG